jgi:hypothetical protein
MSTLKLQIKGWEDGERIDKILEKPDRWQLHSADQVSEFDSYACQSSGVCTSSMHITPHHL